MLKAGTLNRRIRIEAPGNTQDAAGQPISGWVLFKMLWAGFGGMNGRQYLAAGKEVSEANVSIRIRYRTDITAAMRVVHGTVVYEILAVLPDEKNREHVDLVCKTGAKK